MRPLYIVGGEPERAPHKRVVNARNVYWGEPERAPHKRYFNVRSVYIYYGTTVMITRAPLHRLSTKAACNVFG